jgi:hypothetical protein
MQKAFGLAAAVFLAFATVAPALAGPIENAPFQAGSTLAAVIQIVNSVGDDPFSTNDLATTLSNGTPTQHYGPFASGSPDSSTCGNDWAQDTFDRHFTVRMEGDQLHCGRAVQEWQFYDNSRAKPRWM